MPTYRVIRQSDGRTVYAYTADAPVNFAEYPFSTHSHVEEVAIRSDGAVEADPSWVITKLAFRNRFTQAEKVAIEISALDNTAATMEQRSLSATLRANQLDIAAAQFIDLKRPDTRSGVQALEAYGLIAAGRAAQILDTPPTAVEKYNG